MSASFAPFVYKLAKSMAGFPLKYIPKESGGCIILMTDGRKVHFDEHQIEKAKELELPTAKIIAPPDAPTQPRELSAHDKKQLAEYHKKR